MEKTPFHKQSLQLKNIPGIFLIVCLVGITYFLYEMIAPFLPVVIVAAVLTAAFYPLYKIFVKLFRGRKTIASIVMCLLMIVVIIVPLTVFIMYLANEALNAYTLLDQKMQAGTIDSYFSMNKGSFLYNIKMRLAPIININPVYMKAEITDVAKNISTFLVDKSAELLKNATTMIIGFLFTLFTMYFFFKDGYVLIQKAVHLLPLPDRYEKVLLTKLSQTTRSIFQGIFATAIAQGFMAGIGFWIAGVPNAALWGTLSGFFSMVPYIGTAVIWLPASIVLLTSGHVSSGVFLIIWGLFIVSTIDNIVRAFVIGGGIKTYPLLVFFVVFGGFITFGFPGILYGPLVLTVFLSLLDIYKMEYAKVLDGMSDENK
ncbi:MAG: AI-2E family transporter [Candidatus Gracilibacteria bacterium]